MASLNDLHNKVTVLEKTVNSLIEKVDALSNDLDQKPSQGALNALSVDLRQIFSGQQDQINDVEKKVSNIVLPSDTIALIGESELRNIRAHIKQLIVLRDELKSQQKRMVVMLSAYDMGQSSIINP